MRTISQIYSEAVATRNDYLQLTELNSGRSNSKLSIINMLTYVVAVCIHTYEVILDVFQVRIAEALVGRINGTPDWYAKTALKFQYNSSTGMGDEIVFNEDTMKIEYVNVNTANRIVESAAWQMDENDTLLLKVCKQSSETQKQNGVPHIPLTTSELTAFRAFIDKIRFVGASIYCESLPGDILTIVSTSESPIFYNDTYITAAQALENIKKAMVDFVNTVEYNGYVYYQDIIDVLQKTEYISYISHGVQVLVESYNPIDNIYEEAIDLSTRARIRSGYLQLLDAKSQTTINASNIVLVPASQIDQYPA